MPDPAGLLIPPVPGAAPEIFNLLDRPDAFARVSDWLWREWGAGRNQTPTERDAELSNCTARLGPDQCLVLIVDGEAAATASLTAHDFDLRPDLGPWLASVFVALEHRGRGYAQRLVAAVETQAARAGIDRLWLVTVYAERLYAGLGWAVIDRMRDGADIQVLMSKPIAPASKGQGRDEATK